MVLSHRRKSSLSHLCMLKTVQCLQQGHWIQEDWCENSSQDGNPFCALASSLINDLIGDLYKHTDKGSTFKLFQQLRPLVLSGRVESIKVPIQFDTPNDTVRFLQLLAGNAKNLKSLELVQIGLDSQDLWRNRVIENINRVLKFAVNLQCFTTNVSFNMRNIRTLKKVHTLRLNVLPLNIRSIVPHTNSSVSNIRFLYLKDSLYENWSNPIKDIAFLLAHLIHLQFIQSNIAESLDFLHGKDFGNGQVSTRYKLSKAHLYPYSVRQTKIFLLTCPDLVNLHLYLDSSVSLDEFSSLSTTFQIQHLTLKTLCLFPMSADPEYSSSMASQDSDQFTSKFLRFVSFPTLKCIFGPHLRTLKVDSGISHVDFELLDALCPHLTKLKMKIISDTEPSFPLKKCFLNLQHLTLTYVGRVSKVSAENLLLLTSSPLLEVLELHGACFLTDGVLHRIVQRNGLINAKKIVFQLCGLTVDGLKTVLLGCPELTDITVNANLYTEKDTDILKFAHSVNPDVNLRSKRMRCSCGSFNNQ